MNCLARKINEFKQLIRNQNVTLRRKMMLYLACMFMAGAGVFVFLLTATGYFFNAEDRLEWTLRNRLEQVTEKMSLEMENYAGYSLNLSKQLSRTIETQMEGKEKSISEFTDSGDKLVALQKSMYPDLNTVLLTSGCKGVYAVIDATINSALPEAGHSRSGLYLRQGNSGNNITGFSDPYLFRGSPEVARENGFGLHNRWNLEFDTDLLPGYQEVLEQTSDHTKEIYWTTKMVLKGTWEEVILSCAPIVGSNGEIYGICGIELSSTNFKKEYPVKESDFGTILTLISPKEENVLCLECGMAGNMEGTWVKGFEVFDEIPGKRYATYRSDSGSFLGMKSDLSIIDQNGNEWVAAVLISKDKSMAYIQKWRLIVMAIVAAFIVLMLVAAYLLSRKFVKPILQGFEEIKENKPVTDKNASKIAEIEELKSFIASKRENTKIKELPENIEEMLRDFEERVQRLTPTERILLNFFAQNYTLEEIADKMYISIATAKKHNTNMNRKLEITSRSQLMVYVELFKRCNRLEDIISDMEQ